MKALYFDGKRLRERRLPKPAPARGDALVRITLAGICSTDLEILKGYMGFRGIPGHEFVGTVVYSPGRRLDGKRVTGEINIPCLRCALCRGALSKHCGQRGVLGISGKDGAFAEYMTLPARNLHPVSDRIEDTAAVFTELLAAACEIPESVRIRKTDRIAVLGDGRLGAMVAQVIALRAKDVTVIGRHPEKLRIIRSVGIRTAMPGSAPRGRSFDLVAECTGSPYGLPEAAKLVRPRGTILLKSTFHGGTSWNPSSLVVDEIRLIGSRCGPFDKALDLLERGKVSVSPFLTAVYPFERWEEAIRRAGRRDAFKVLIGFK